MLQIDHLSKSFKNKCVLDSITTNIYPGQITALIGPNGSGKSTFFKILAGILAPSKGQFIISTSTGDSSFNHDISSTNTSYTQNDISLCLQDTVYWKHLTLYEHYEFVRKSLSSKNSYNHINKSSIDDIMKKLNLLNYKDYFINELSGGYKKRFSIGLSLISNPKYLLLDEPGNGLDFFSKNKLHNILNDLCSERKMGIIISGHNLIDLEKLANRFIFLENGRLIHDIDLKKLKDQFNGSLEKAYSNFYEDRMEV